MPAGIRTGYYRFILTFMLHRERLLKVEGCTKQLDHFVYIAIVFCWIIYLFLLIRYLSCKYKLLKKCILCAQEDSSSYNDISLAW